MLLQPYNANERSNFQEFRKQGSRLVLTFGITVTYSVRLREPAG